MERFPIESNSPRHESRSSRGRSSRVHTGDRPRHARNHKSQLTPLQMRGNENNSGNPPRNTSRSSRGGSSGAPTASRPRHSEKHRSQLTPLQTMDIESDGRGPRTPDTVNSSSSNERRKKRYIRTPDTVASTPNTVSSSSSDVGRKKRYTGSAPPAIVIENRVSRQTEERSVGFCTRRKFMCCLIIYCLIATGVGVYFFRYLLVVANLKSQIDRLSNENDRLEDTVEDLSNEINRLQNTTDDLEKNVIDLDQENNETKDLIERFNASIKEYKLMNKQLQEENDQYKLNNQNLNKTIENLDYQIINLLETEIELRASIVEYQGTNERLEYEISELEAVRESLNNSVLDLNIAVDNFKAENDRMVEINRELNTILSFINSTFEDTEQTYEDLISALDETIVQSRTLAEEGLKNRMKTEANGWECGLSIAFGMEPFIEDTTLSIGSESYPFVIDYIESKVLADLCIDTANFELYLAREILDESSEVSDASISDLTLGLNLMSNLAFQYYFMGVKGGLTGEDWDFASYDCDNLQDEQRFRYE